MFYNSSGALCSATIVLKGYLDETKIDIFNKIIKCIIVITDDSFGNFIPDI